MKKVRLELVDHVRSERDSVLFAASSGVAERLAVGCMIPTDFSAGDDVRPEGVVSSAGDGIQLVLLI